MDNFEINIMFSEKGVQIQTNPKSGPVAIVGFLEMAKYALMNAPKFDPLERIALPK